MKSKIRPIRNIMKTRLHAIRASYSYLSCLALGVMLALSTQTSLRAAGPLVQSVTPILTLEHVRVAFSVSVDPDRKSTRLNSSHLGISYAVFCLKKKTRQ